MEEKKMVNCFDPNGKLHVLEESEAKARVAQYGYTMEAIEEQPAPVEEEQVQLQDQASEDEHNQTWP